MIAEFHELHELDQKPTGRKIKFEGIEFIPLQYNDLATKKLHNEVEIPLTWKNAKIVDSDIPDINIGMYASVNTTLKSSYTSKAIGLVRGGWLPSGFALSHDTIVIPDRNIITDIKGRFKNGTIANSAKHDFLDLFFNTGIRINPFLYALEGNLRQNPTPDLIEQQLDEVMSALKASLPQAELVPADKSSLQGIIGIIQDTQAGMERKQKFLIQLAPRLQNPISAKKRDAMWKEILITAKNHKLPKESLVVMAALSSISVPNGQNPAKRLLKPRSDYTAADAYNALSDLRSLEILSSLFALFPDQRLMLCTKDKNLALFWAGLRASQFEWTAEYPTAKFSPVDELFPNITSAQRDYLFIPDD